MQKIKAFTKGMVEFRLSTTTSYSDYDLMCAYDLGREWAHRLTLRKYDDAQP